MTGLRRIHHAITDLKLSYPIIVDASHCFVPLHFISALTTRIVRAFGSAEQQLLLSNEQLATLGLPKDSVFRIDLPENLETLLKDLSSQEQPPYIESSPIPQNPRDSLFLGLLKRIPLSPMALKIKVTQHLRPMMKQVDLPEINSRQIEHFMCLSASSTPIELCRTSIVLEKAGHVEIRLFQDSVTQTEHLALIKTNAQIVAPTGLVRLHSSCLTGDVFRSLTCDCGTQLSMALEQLADYEPNVRHRVVVYLNQEGRGIGLLNKLRSYNLQRAGLNTFKANQVLGFRSDERDYHLAAKILQKIGIESCILLSNNNQKAQMLEKHGIEVSQCIPLLSSPNQHNEFYLKTKNNNNSV